MIQRVLERIELGEKAFSANQDDHGSIKEFQTLARSLKAAEDRGFISKVSFITSKKRDSHGMYLKAVVSNGLTYEGEKALETFRAGLIARAIAKIMKALPKVLIGVATLIIGGLALKACGL